MSSSKNYNSIVFLTTLSVYLGLVLVGGASSPVLAQAALTRNFDIQEEIEYKDDLDKKPDEDKILSEYLDSFQTLYKLAKEFAEKHAGNSGNYEFNCSAFAGKQSNFTVNCKNGTGTFTGAFIPQISHIRSTFSSEIFGKNRQVNINLLLSTNDFLIKTSFSRNAELQKSIFDTFLNEVLFHSEVQNLEDRLKIYGQETTVTCENDQIFIVTNLPRASIDSLFAEKNAK